MHRSRATSRRSRVGEGNESTFGDRPKTALDADANEDWFENVALKTPGNDSRKNIARYDPDSAYGERPRGRLNDVSNAWADAGRARADALGSPSKQRRTTSPEQVLERVDDAIDVAIEAVMQGTIGTANAVTQALSRGASSFLGGNWMEGLTDAGVAKRASEDRSRATPGRCETPGGKENLAPRAMSFVPTPSKREDETTALRQELANANAKLKESNKEKEELRRQNMALQRRHASKEAKGAVDPETTALVEQLRAQVQALMSEKASLSIENQRLVRENGELREFAGGFAGDSDDDCDVCEEDLSAIGNLTPQAIEELEREIAQMEASMSTTLDYSAHDSSVSDTSTDEYAA